MVPAFIETSIHHLQNDNNNNYYYYYYWHYYYYYHYNPITFNKCQLQPFAVAKPRDIVEQPQQSSNI
jgi:hypothetical protein